MTQRYSRALVLIIMATALTACGSTQAGPAADPAIPESATSTEPTVLGPPCDTGLRIQGDGPTYGSLSELVSGGDLIVRGRVEQQRCVPGDPLDDEQIYYLVSEVAVQETWKATNAGHDRVTVVQLPGAQEDSTPLKPGADVLLFLHAEEPGEAALQEELDLHWTPLGWDNGIADVDHATGAVTFRDSVVQPRTASLSDVTEALLP